MMTKFDYINIKEFPFKQNNKLYNDSNGSIENSSSEGGKMNTAFTRKCKVQYDYAQLSQNRFSQKQSANSSVKFVILYPWEKLVSSCRAKLSNEHNKCSNGLVGY